MKKTKEQKEQTEQFIKLVPSGQSPKLYVDLVNKTILGVDKDGKPRPIEDLKLFLYVCKRTKLDPLVRQIYAVYRWDSRQGAEKMVIQVGIDGMRLTAQRTKRYGGQDDVVFEPPEGINPAKATSTVYIINQMTGERMPVTASARWTEYAQTDKEGKPVQMWAKMPFLMLGKVSEALALRKAFPNELSGIYSEDELAQIENPVAKLPTPESKKKVKDDEFYDNSNSGLLKKENEERTKLREVLIAKDIANVKMVGELKPVDVKEEITEKITKLREGLKNEN